MLRMYDKLNEMIIQNLNIILFLCFIKRFDCNAYVLHVLFLNNKSKQIWMSKEEARKYAPFVSYKGKTLWKDIPRVLTLKSVATKFNYQCHGWIYTSNDHGPQTASIHWMKTWLID